jgi:hypothetical protein
MMWGFHEGMGWWWVFGGMWMHVTLGEMLGDQNLAIFGGGFGESRGEVIFGVDL